MKKQAPQDKDKTKTKDQLVKELAKLRKRLTKLEKSKIGRKRAEEALRESEERFRSITESTSDAIVAVDSQGKINLRNKAAREIFGYEEEEILGKPIQILLPERFRDTDRKGMEEFLETATSPFIGRSVESICLKKDGSESLEGLRHLFGTQIDRSRWRDGSLF